MAAVLIRVTAILAVISAVLSSFLFAVIWKYYYTTSKPFRVTEILGFVAILLYAIAASVLSNVFINVSMNITTYYLLIELWDLLWRFGTIFVYILFMKRLEITFKNTIYSISIWIKRFVYFGCLIFILLLIMAQTLYYMDYGNWKKTFRPLDFIISHRL